MDDLGKGIPMAEGMIDAENEGQKKGANEFCLNCGTKLLDTFCHHCGQKDIPRRQTLGELWINFISSFWSYEGKFLTTTKYLIIKPGFLALEYNAGRRESYYHPARMYVFISFVFFLLFLSLPDVKVIKNVKNTVNDDDVRKAMQELREEKLDSLLDLTPADSAEAYSSLKKKESADSTNSNLFNLAFNGKAHKSVASYDSAQAGLSDSEKDGWFKRRVKYRSIELKQRYGTDSKKLLEDIGTAFKENFSKILFFLLPVFALLLKLLYVRKDFFYSEHLVFSIYYYNFFYLAASIQMLVAHAPVLSGISFLIGWWIFFYMLFAMKRMYNQSWIKTILKFILFVSSFWFFVAIAVVINMVVLLMII